jgi:hypothetical protein
MPVENWKKGNPDKMICRRCFSLSLICFFLLSSNVIAFGQISVSMGSPG